jgi:hypothetical protein
MESTDYDKFEYKHFDDPALPLDEAIKTVRRLQASDAGHLHRIVPADSDLTIFYVESISRDTLYAQMLGRWAGLLNKFVSKATVKR